MKRFYSLAVITLALLGCTHSREVKISSDPPGAHVEINGDYVGRTPFTTRVRTNDGVSIVATPHQDGLCKQEGYYSPSAEIPEHVFLNMRLCERKPAATVAPAIPPINNYNIQNNDDAKTNIGE